MKNVVLFPWIHIILISSLLARPDKMNIRAGTALAVEMTIDNEFIKFLYELFQFCGGFIPVTGEGVLPPDRSIRPRVTSCFLNVHEVMVFSEDLFPFGG